MTSIPSVNFIPRISFGNGSGRRSGADFLRGQLRSLLDKRVGDACHHVARAVCRHRRPSLGQKDVVCPSTGSCSHLARRNARISSLPGGCTDGTRVCGG